MNTEYVEGQRILRVKQGKVKRGKGRKPCNAVKELELENGVKLVPVVLEAAGNCVVDFVVNVQGIKSIRLGGRQIHCGETET